MHCWSTDVVPTPVSGRGTVFLLTLLHQGPTCRRRRLLHLLAAGRVELEEQPGLRLSATIVNCPSEQLGLASRVDRSPGSSGRVPLVRLPPAPSRVTAHEQPLSRQGPDRHRRYRAFALLARSGAVTELTLVLEACVARHSGCRSSRQRHRWGGGRRLPHRRNRPHGGQHGHRVPGLTYWAPARRPS